MSKSSEEFFKRELHLLENEAEKADNDYTPIWAKAHDFNRGMKP